MGNLFRVASPARERGGLGLLVHARHANLLPISNRKQFLYGLQREWGRGTAVPYLPMRAACTSGCFYISFIIFSSFLFFFFFFFVGGANLQDGRGCLATARPKCRSCWAGRNRATGATPFHLNSALTHTHTDAHARTPGHVTCSAGGLS